MEDYEWYLQQQEDEVHQSYHGAIFDQYFLTDNHHSSFDGSLFNFLGFDDPCQAPFEPGNNPVIFDTTYADCLANFSDPFDSTISPISRHDSHQPNYQTLGVQDFSDFETWWNANLSILLYSDINDNADIHAASDTGPVLITTSSTYSTTHVDIPAAVGASSGNFNRVIEEDRESFTYIDADHDHHEVAVIRKMRRRQEFKSRRPKSSNLEYEEIQKYFHVPITEAAKELRVGVTVLKKRCRELDIARWPHRKIKSLNGLIVNVKELGVTNEEEIKILEAHKRALETVPGLELTSRTKKLRQACFKANYKRRRLGQLMIASTSSSDS